MNDDEISALARDIQRALLSDPGIATLYPLPGIGQLVNAAATLWGARDADTPAVRIQEKDGVAVEVALGVTAARPAADTAREAQRVIRAAVPAVPVQVRVTLVHLDMPETDGDATV